MQAVLIYSADNYVVDLCTFMRRFTVSVRWIYAAYSQNDDVDG